MQCLKPAHAAVPITVQKSEHTEGSYSGLSASQFSVHRLYGISAEHSQKFIIAAFITSAAANH
jgi:hypothetical protein